MPMSVLAITNRCQQRCVFCLEGRFKGAREAARDMPFPAVVRLLEQAREIGASVTFMGAETALHPDFIPILRQSVRLGLTPKVTTNLQSFADKAFLERCVEAGLDSVEGSFHHPDAESFSRGTQTSPRNFDRLLKALENIRALYGRPGVSFFGACVNVVIQRHNVERLDEILSLLKRRLGGALRQIQFKKLLTTTRGERHEDIDSSLLPQPRTFRASLLDLLRHWDSPGTLPILRNLPLCIAPGYAHLNWDLTRHCRRTPAFTNRGHWERISAYSHYGPFRLSSELPPECGECSLTGLCLTVTRGMTAASYGLPPEPSAQAPADVLRDRGLGPEESASFLARSARALAQALSAAAAPPTACEPEISALRRRLGRLLSSASAPEDFAGFRVSLVAVPAGERAVVVTLLKEAPGSRRPDRLLVEVAPIEGRRSSCFGQAGDYAVSYRMETPLDCQPRRQALERFLDYLRRSLGR